MSQKHPFTISSFYNYVSQKQLMGAKCNECGNVLLPPKPMCTKCLSTDLKWVEIEGTGKLVSYTVIHVAPIKFQSLAPYTVGIVELNNGLRIPGMIKDECGVNISADNIEVGMKLEVDFDPEAPTEWPSWPRYFFRLP